MPSRIEAERYKQPPSLAEADALRAIKRELEIRRLLTELIATLASLYQEEGTTR